MYFVLDDKGCSAAAQRVDAQALFAPLAYKVLSLLAFTPDYPASLAKKLHVHEQKVYYHIRKLERAGIISVTREEIMGGSTAKFYAVSPALCVLLGDMKPTTKIQHLSAEEESYLSPFITNGQLNAKIVTGSPDPHGPEKARSRDGYYGIDLGLFLGKYLHHTPAPAVKLDTEFRKEDWQNNLILLGGPITNRIVAQVNKYLPVRFETNHSLHSTISNQDYVADEVGVVQKIPNPFCAGKTILLIAGKRYIGTRAAIIAFLQAFPEILKGNRVKRSVFATVVEGIDMDSDGLIDTVEIRE